MEIAGLILAAGKGTRMKSDLPKGLHEVMGWPLVEHVRRAMIGAGVTRPVLVIGHGAEKMRARFEGEGCEFAVQSEQLGTGHAALMAHDALNEFDGPVIVSPGDTPLIDAAALKQLVEEHLRAGSSVTVATFCVNDPTGYGRVVRNAQGMPIRIVEQKDASPEEQKITEVNSSVYCFDSKTLFNLLPKLKNDNQAGEYYLTDVLKMLSDSGAVTHAVSYSDDSIFQGVNDRWQLSEAEAKMRLKILKQHAVNGVTIVDPSTTFVGPEVEIGVDAKLEPMTVIEGQSKIGAGAVIGSFSRICESEIGERTKVHASFVECSRVGPDCWIGPYAHLRPGSVLGSKCKIGNYVEIKKSELGNEVSAGHLSYIGDAKVGAKSNIGAGTITCNYDGEKKHMTVIGAKAFIGSNSTLVAPVTIGDGAYVAAGSTITQDVHEGALALGRARQIEKEQWAQRRREKSNGS